MGRFSCAWISRKLDMNCGGNHAVIATLPTREAGLGAGTGRRSGFAAGAVAGVVVLLAGTAALLRAACMFGFFMTFLSEFCFHPQIELLQFGGGFAFRLDLLNALSRCWGISVAGALAEVDRARA